MAEPFLPYAPFMSGYKAPMLELQPVFVVPSDYDDTQNGYQLPEGFDETLASVLAQKNLGFNPKVRKFRVVRSEKTSSYFQDAVGPDFFNRATAEAGEPWADGVGTMAFVPGVNRDYQAWGGHRVGDKWTGGAAFGGEYVSDPSPFADTILHEMGHMAGMSHSKEGLMRAQGHDGMTEEERRRMQDFYGPRHRLFGAAPMQTSPYGPVPSEWIG